MVGRLVQRGSVGGEGGRRGEGRDGRDRAREREEEAEPTPVLGVLEITPRGHGFIRAAEGGSGVDRVRAAADNRRLWSAVYGAVTEPAKTRVGMTATATMTSSSVRTGNARGK